MQKILKIIIIFIGIFAFIRGLGWILDYHSEIVHAQTYLKNKKGIIYGKESKEIKQGGRTAVVFIHGFLSHPTSHDITLDAIIPRLPDVDFYVPLLPYHGRGLAKSKEFKAKDIEIFVKEYIQEKAQAYENVYVIGVSFGATVLSKFALEKDFPENVSLILQTPAFYLKQNSQENRIKLWVMTWFRDYCPYVSVGCGRDLNSVDEVGFQEEIGQVVSGHVIIPAVRNLFAYENKNIHNLRKLNKEYHIIMALDDNKVDYDLIKKDCDQNPVCHLHTIPSGRHTIHWGKYQKQYQNTLVSLIKN